MTFKEAMQITGNLSRTSKMPCLGWAIPAQECKRGGKLSRVKGSVCSLCYAKRGHFVFTEVQKVFYKRLESMQNPLWAEAMATVIKQKEHSGYFRWFISGDIQSLGDLLKICQVARLTPKIKHWLPTHEIGIIGDFKRARFEFPKNLIVRLSADMMESNPPRATNEKSWHLGKFC